jgi:hypothetical protein
LDEDAFQEDSETERNMEEFNKKVLEERDENEFSNDSKSICEKKIAMNNGFIFEVCQY